MEAGDESDGQETLLVHLPPQEEVSLQIVQTEVVLTAGRRRWTGGTHGQCYGQVRCCGRSLYKSITTDRVAVLRIKHPGSTDQFFSTVSRETKNRPSRNHESKTEDSNRQDFKV